jgi:hypothetical protein
LSRNGVHDLSTVIIIFTPVNVDKRLEVDPKTKTEKPQDYKKAEIKEQVITLWGKTLHNSCRSLWEPRRRSIS